MDSSLELTSSSHDAAGVVEAPAVESPAVTGTESAVLPEPEVASDFVGLGEDGNVTFGDGFFGDLGKDPEADDPAKVERSATQAAETKPEGEAPTFYTPEDLKSVGLDQLDEARLPESVRPFFPLVREQLQRVAQKEQALAQREAMLMHYAQQQKAGAAGAPAAQEAKEPPKPLTPKELVGQAMKLAAERLGIEPDEVDTYTPEHIAALSMATFELSEKARQERQEAERSVQQREAEEARHKQGAQDFQGFASQLTALPDFKPFDTWVTQQLATRGMHPNQLAAYAQQTGDYAGVQRTIAEMYQTWRQSAQQTAKPKAEPKVPVVEGAGGAAAVKKAVDLSQFAELGEDAQAKAIRDLGLV